MLDPMRRNKLSSKQIYYLDVNKRIDIFAPEKYSNEHLTWVSDCGCAIYEYDKLISFETMDDLISKKEQRYIMRRFLNGLNRGEKRVLILRYYFEWTLKAVGDYFFVEKERIRQIEAKALRRLRFRMKDVKI